MKRPIKTITIVLLTAALQLAPCAAALNAYLELTGETQGNIEGSVTTAGREGTTEIISMEHQVVTPRDAATGLPTGRRVHTPIKLTMAVDKSTPLLAQALANNENLPTFTLKFYRPDGNGAEQHYYTIELINAQVSSVRMWKPNTRDAAAVALPDMVEVQFTYQRIRWTWQDGGITAEDDWATPRA